MLQHVHFVSEIDLMGSRIIKLEEEGSQKDDKIRKLEEEGKKIYYLFNYIYNI